MGCECKQLKDEVLDYVTKSQFAVLNYVRADKAPVSRAMGSFVPSGLDLYFSSKKEAAKVKEIATNKRVSFFFEHENQELSAWKNVLFIGDAELVEGGAELDKAVELLSARNPRFKERVAKGELPQTAIFRVKTREIEYLDRTKGQGFVKKLTV